MTAIINGFNVTRRMPTFIPELRHAIRSGRKTQTRRVMKFHWKAYEPDLSWIVSVNQDGKDGWIGWSCKMTDEESRRRYPDGGGYKCPFGKVGDISVMPEPLFRTNDGYAAYSDDGWIERRVEIDGNPVKWQWKPDHLSSMFMPVWAGRTIVRYTGIRVERLQSITDKDALAEGVRLTGCTRYEGEARIEYAKLWDGLNAKTNPWSSNPWVWVLEWEKLQ